MATTDTVLRFQCLFCSSGRFIRLYDNPANEEKKKKKDEEKKKEKKKKWRWREQRNEEVKKDSREKEFIEAYISTLQDRGETKIFIIL